MHQVEIFGAFFIFLSLKNIIYLYNMYKINYINEQEN
jgi:hypothetical protein